MVDISSFTNPGAAGLAVLHQTTNARWLRQPSADMSVFRGHKTVAFNWKAGAQIGPHRYDKNKAHVGVASSVLVGVGEPVYFRSVPRDMGKEAGIWHILLHAGSEDTRLPPIVSKRDCWVYTPILQLLIKLGYAVEIKEAYVFGEQHQVFRGFYEEMKAQLEAAAGDAQKVQAVKDIYTVFFGVLAHPKDNPRPGYIYRPDWLFTVVAEAKARMYYQLLKVWREQGALPNAIKTDALYYDRPVELPMGPNIGQFKYKLLSSEEDE
jgi:hypothetical protein